MERFDTILRYWFGTCEDDLLYDRNQLILWNTESDNFDQEIAEQFHADLDQARNHQIDTWNKTARGRLALILVLDQFAPRMLRNSPLAFQEAHLAQHLSVEGLDMAMDFDLTPIERIFFYHPLTSAEDLSLQRRGVKAYESLVKSLPTELRHYYEPFLQKAVAHKNVIERFGRFPERNALLMRESTTQELKYLSESLDNPV